LLRTVRTFRSEHELRIPMPAVAAVGAATEVLREPRQILGARAMRQVFGDGVRGFFQRSETVEMRAHEADDALHADGLHAWRDVDEHNRGETLPRRLALSQQRGEAAEGSTDHRRR